MKKQRIDAEQRDIKSFTMDEDKEGFDTVGGKDIDNQNLVALRANGSIGPGGKGQAVRLTEKDEIRGQRVAEEYVFNIVASNKVSLPIRVSAR